MPLTNDSQPPSPTHPPCDLQSPGKVSTLPLLLLPVLGRSSAGFEPELCPCSWATWPWWSDLFSYPHPFFSVPKDNCVTLPGSLREYVDKPSASFSLQPFPLESGWKDHGGWHLSLLSPWPHSSLISLTSVTRAHRDMITLFHPKFELHTNTWPH